MACPAGEPEFCTIEANLRETMKFFAGATEEGETCEAGGLSLVSSGLNHGVFNTALLCGRVAGEAELARRIAAADLFFARKGLRWSFWVCEDLLERNLRKRVKTMFTDRGFRSLVEPPGMIAERILPGWRTSNLQFAPVCDARTRTDFAAITSVCFDLPLAVARDIYMQERPWGSTFHGYVGYVDGSAVVTAASVVAAGAVGMYSVATMPQHRRKGYGEDIVRHVLAECGRTTGITRTVLQSTRAGLNLYERLGYRTVTRFGVYLSC
jgi:ribosomal protein S18 acetylase RimI-like enzyme